MCALSGLVVHLSPRGSRASKSVTQNLSDGLRAVVMSFAGRTHSHLSLGIYADM